MLYFLVALTLPSSWEAPAVPPGALELSKHPKWGSGEVPYSFVSAISARETSAAQCKILGVRLLGSWYGCSAVPHSHATIYPFGSPLPRSGQTASPSCTTGCPFTSQGHRQSTSDDAHLCVLWELCPRLALFSFFFFYTRTSSINKCVVSFYRKWELCQIRWPAFKCVQGINKSLQQITVSKFRGENDFC